MKDSIFKACVAALAGSRRLGPGAKDVKPQAGRPSQVVGRRGRRPIRPPRVEAIDGGKMATGEVIVAATGHEAGCLGAGNRHGTCFLLIMH